MAAPSRGGSRPAGSISPTESAGGDQPWRPNWNPLQPGLMVGAAYSYSTSGSTTSGTFSTTYTSSRGSAAVSSGLAAGEVSSWRWRLVEDLEQEKAKRLERAGRLVKEFCHGDGDVGALESWFLEIGLGWVLRLSNDASAGTTSVLPDDERSLSQKRWLWIRALTDIIDSIDACTSFTSHWFPDRGISVLKINSLLARLVEATVVKMLPFVDALLAADLDATTGIITDSGNGAQMLSGKFQPLLDVRNALSSTSEVIKFFRWEFSVEMDVIERSDKVCRLLSAKKHKLDEAIWNTMVEIRIDNDDTEWGIQTPQGSSDIARVTRSLIAYIKYLWNNHRLLDEIVRTAAELGIYVPNPDISYLLKVDQQTDPFTMLTLEMVFSLQVKLAKRSESFADNSLRSLFLINNTHFIWQQLSWLGGMEFHLVVLDSKIKEYIQTYLQFSWAPVLSCLYNQTPRCFGTNSALPKFDSEFQKTYDEQKLWKVPDPQLRARLREAIIERVVPAFTKYLEDNKITNPGVTPQEREMMLLELFEG